MALDKQKPETKQEKIERLEDEFANAVDDAENGLVDDAFVLQKYHKLEEATGQKTFAQLFNDGGVTTRCVELKPER